MRDIVDPRGASSGTADSGVVSRLTEREFQQLSPDRVASFGAIEAYEVRGDESVIAVRSRNTFLLLHHPSIRFSQITDLDISDKGLNWTQTGAYSNVAFYFSFEEQCFVYVRGTLR